MSFYIYYGKLGKDLLVAVLPNGTVEVDDRLYLSSENGIFSYRAREVTTTEDGEDRITFADGLASYVATSKQGYKELSITRTIKNEKVSANLTRKYDQPLTAISSTSKPRIWSGRLNFHDWAKNEEIVVVAPKGVGNKKPIVALWQWTEDQKKEKGTLSHAVSEQESDASNPNKFTFKQNGYYTLTCEFKSATEALGLKIKGPADQGPSNAEQEQKDLASSKVDLTEARFTPPRATQTKFSLDCSFPAAKPNIARVNKQLPFPAGLIETLQHTAAYLDHAGGLAKYANKQFDKVYERNEQLEKKVQAKEKTITDLNDKVKGLQSDKEKLSAENERLTKENADIRAAAAAEKKALEEQLKKAMDALVASQNREKDLAAENKCLEQYIEKDRVDDIRREKSWQKHHAKDMEAYQLLEDQFEEAKCTIRSLKTDLHESNEKARNLKIKLNDTEKWLREAEETIRCLTADVEHERQLKVLAQEELAVVTKKLADAVRDLEHLRSENATLTCALETEKKTVEALKIKEAELQKKLDDTTVALGKANTELTRAKKLLEANTLEIEDLRESVASRDKLLKDKEAECEKKEKQLAEKQTELDNLDQVKDTMETEKNKEIARKNKNIENLRALIQDGTEGGLAKELKSKDDEIERLQALLKAPVVDVTKNKAVTVTTAEVKADA